MSTQGFKRSTLSLAVLMAIHGGVQAQGAPAQEEAAQTLPTINVNASADASAAGLPEEFAGGQVARGSRLGILGNVDLMDAPFSATSYTHALMQDQQTKSVGDVLLNDPTVRVARGFGNFQELYVVRGFPIYSDDMAYNGLYGLLPRQYVATEFLERVEVLRGANTFLNGAAPGGTGIGGAVNLVPKRAPNDPLTQFSLGIDNGGQAYAATDLARRFGPDQSTGIRLNLARRAGDTAIDNEHRELNVASVGLDYRSRNVRLSADLGFQQYNLDQARPSVTPGSSGLPIAAAPRASSNFSQPWSFSDERDTFGTVRGEFDLAQDVTAWAAAGARRGNERNSLVSPTLTSITGDISNSRFDNARQDTVRTGEIGIRGKLVTGSVSHALSASASTFRLDSRNAYAFGSGAASNLYAPVTIPLPAIAGAGGSLDAPHITGKTELSSLAVADTMSFAQDRVLLTLGLRHQSIKDQSFDYNTGTLNTPYADSSAVTPVAGLVFKPVKNVSLYANYIESLAKGPIAPASSGGVAIVNVGEVFSPYRSKQAEIGAKYELGKFGMGLSMFVTRKPMSLVNGNVFTVDGEQLNRGIELSMFGEPTRGVRLLGGLSLLDAEQRKTQGGVNEGNNVIGTPHTQANVGAEWDIPGVRGLSLNGRMIYTSSQYADGANLQKIPSWTRFDTGLRYVTAIDKQTLTLRGAVENLANKAYWASAGGYPGAGYLVLGAPRTLVLSASVDF